MKHSTNGPPIQMQQQRQQSRPGTRHHKTQGDGAANRPVPQSREHKLKLHQQSCGKKHNGDATPMRSESTSTLRSSPEKRAAANTLNSKTTKESYLAPPKTALTAKTRTARAALAQGIKCLDSLCATSKRLTFVPMSAWVNNAGEDDLAIREVTRNWNDKQLPAKQQSPAGDQHSVRWPWGNVQEEASPNSVSTFEQQFSLDSRSTSTFSAVAPKLKSHVLQSSSLTRTPHPGQTSSASSPSTRPLRAQSPRSPPPTQQRPPPPPPRTVSAGNRRVLHHPADVAALLHEVLKGSSGLGEMGEKISVGQVGKNKKSNGVRMSSSSQDSGILDALARIIADRITSGDRKKNSRVKKKQAAALNQLKVNRALLATGESNCNGDGNLVGKKASGLHSKPATFYSSRQQNFNNCYEKPTKKVRYLNQNRSDIPDHISQCPRRSNVSCNLTVERHFEAHSDRLREIELLTGKLQAKERQSSPNHNQRRRRSVHDKKMSRAPASPTSLKNGSNAIYPILPGAREFERNVPQSSNRKTIKHCDGIQPCVSPVTENRQVQRRSTNCCSAADNDSTKCQRSERVITTSSTGTYSTEDALFVQRNISLSNIQDHSHHYPKFDCTDWRETTEGASLVSCCSMAMETTVDSPSLVTDKSGSQRQHSQSVVAGAGRQPNEPEQGSAAEYAQQLFGSLLKGRDESGLLRPLADAPRELSLSSIFQGISSVDSETETLLKRSPMKILVPDFMLKGKAAEGTGQHSSESHSLILNDSRRHTDIRMPIPPFNLTPEKSIQSDNLVSPPAHKAVELPSVAGLPYQLAECIDWVSRKSRQPSHKSRLIQPDYKTVRRRSRIHVVEPLADAVQQRIELPAEIIEKLFSSSRPIKHSQLLIFIVPIFSIERMLETSESLFSHSSGSVGTADLNVTTAVYKRDCCYIIESVIFSCARSMASRVIESLGISNLLLDSPIVARLLNQSLIKTGRIASDHTFHDRSSCRFGFTNCTADIVQHLHSFGSRHKGSLLREAKPSVKRSCCFSHITNHDIELIRVATHLAVRLRCVKRPDHRRHDRHRQCRGSGARSMSSRISRSPVSSDTTAEADSLHQDTQRVVPDSESHRPGTAIADIDSVVNEFMQLESGDFARTIVSHCPELITNPNLTCCQTRISKTDYPYAINSEPPGYTIDNATSDFMSGDTIAMQQCIPNPSSHMRAQRETTVEVTDEVVLHEKDLHPLAVDGGYTGLLRTVEVPMTERPHRQQQQKQQLPGRHLLQQTGLFAPLNPADGTRSESNQADPATAKCPCQDACSCGTDLSQRRSYNSHSFLSHKAAVIPGRAEDNRGVLLSITCQLTVIDRAVDSRSFEESISTDCSELVYALTD